MAAFGGELVEHGHDFQAAYDHAIATAERENLHLVRSYHPLLVRGVASYGLELFAAAGDFDTVYVPIGQGSGITGVVAATRLRQGFAGVKVQGRRSFSEGGRPGPITTGRSC